MKFYLHREKIKHLNNAHSISKKSFLGVTKSGVGFDGYGFFTFNYSFNLQVKDPPPVHWYSVKFNSKKGWINAVSVEE